jgi:DNA-binding transcriptional LysR family regulator
MNGFDWEDFRHFSALGRTLNLAEAAALLGTSQVTVMRRVKSLEHRLGATLFIRRRDGHRLTAAGNRLIGIAEDARQLLAGVGGAVGGNDAEGLGRVRIATTEVGANWLLLSHLAGFCAEHPGLTLEIDASPQALDLLEGGETIALRFRRPETGDYAIKRLGSMRYALYGSRSLEAGGKSMPYVGWAGPFAEIGLSRWLRSVFAGHMPSLHLTTLHGHVVAARAGIGAVGLPVCVGRQFQDLVEIPHTGPEFALEAWLVVPSQIRGIARVKAVARFVEQAVRRSLSPDGPA